MQKKRLLNLILSFGYWSCDGLKFFFLKTLFLLLCLKIKHEYSFKTSIFGYDHKRQKTCNDINMSLLDDAAQRSRCRCLESPNSLWW